MLSKIGPIIAILILGILPITVLMKEKEAMDEYANYRREMVKALKGIEQNLEENKGR